MSRSRRKTPIISNTCSGYRKGEKKDKQMANRKLRRKVNSGETDLVIRDVSDVCWFAKDGKSWWNDEMAYRK